MPSGDKSMNQMAALADLSLKISSGSSILSRCTCPSKTDPFYPFCKVLDFNVGTDTILE